MKRYIFERAHGTWLQGHDPVRSTLIAAALANPAHRIEIDAIAIVRTGLRA
jgi:enamine deaminase RidA (YjgF/YER057c/UK114 family)